MLTELTGRGHRPVGVVRATGATLPPGVGRLVHDLDRVSPDLREQLDRPEVLIHLAWGGLPNYGSAHHLDVEQPRQQRWLDALLQQGIRRVVVAGTCFEYGLTEGRLHEELPPAPVTPYAEAKVRLRTALTERAADAGVELVWARIFYVFGPGQSTATLWGQVQQALVERWSSFPMSPGDQTRDFLPATEAARLLCELALRPLPSHGPLTINVCSGQPVTLRDLVTGWIETAGAELPLELGAYPYAAHEPRHAWGDRTRLDQVLDELPPHPIRSIA